MNILSFLISAALAASAPDFHVQEEGRFLRATPPKGHHFNLKAPHGMHLETSGKSIAPSKETPQDLQFPTPKAGTAFTLTAYLCDEANTYCEKHVFQKGAASQKGIAPSQPKTSSKTPAASSHGGIFLVNKPDLALENAQKLKKPLLIEFFAIWCPGCNMFEETVFSEKDFEKATSEYVRLKLDVDDPVSFPLKSRYKVTGYPTIIFAQSDGTEIGRVIGYKPLDSLKQDLQKAAAPAKSVFISEAADLAEDQLSAAAEKAEKSGDQESAKELYLQCATGYEKRLRSSSSDFRGFSLERAYCLWKGGEVAAAENIYRRFEKLYPDELTFFFNHARMLGNLKRYTEAEPLAAKAFQLSYGDNHLRAADFYAEVMEALGKKDRALLILDETISSCEKPKDETIRTFRYLHQLEARKAKLLAPQG